MAVEELLQRPFVDRVQADERPRGYRRSGRGIVDMLVPGMAEHFIARMRGLWLAYPDGTVVTAREASAQHPTGRTRAARAGRDRARRDRSGGAPCHAGREHGHSQHPPLVQANEPLSGVRPPSERRDLSRTDCGWIC